MEQMPKAGKGSPGGTWKVRLKSGSGRSGIGAVRGSRQDQHRVPNLRKGRGQASQIPVPHQSQGPLPMGGLGQEVRVALKLRLRKGGPGIGNQASRQALRSRASHEAGKPRGIAREQLRRRGKEPPLQARQGQQGGRQKPQGQGHSAPRRRLKAMLKKNSCAGGMTKGQGPGDSEGGKRISQARRQGVPRGAKARR